MAAATDEIEQFKEDVRGREVNTESTLEDYCRWIERFEEWFDGDHPTERTLRRFDSYLFESAEFPWSFTRPIKDESYAYSTRVKALSALKLWLRVHYNEEVTNEVQNIALGERADFDPEILSKRDVRTVIEHCDSACKIEGCKAAYRLGYDAIMRCAEIADVRMEDVDLSNASIYVRAKKGSLNKTIGLDEETVALLEDHVDRFPNRDYLFHNSYGRPWGATENGNKMFAKHFWRKHHDAGIHSFTRHSPIVHRLGDGEDLGDVFQRARHTNLSTTMRYARVIDAEVPDWAEKETSG